MNGILINDLLGLRKTLTYILGFLIIYALLFTGTLGPQFISGFILVLTSMMINSAVTIEDMGKWNVYALTMPVTRKTLVLEKYLLMLILGGGGLLLSSLYTLVISWINNTLDLLDFLVISLLLFSFCLILNSIILPLLFRFGSEKTRYLTIICYGIPAGGIIVLANMGILDRWIDFMYRYTFIVVLSICVLGVIMFLISYRISLKIYQRKEW